MSTVAITVNGVMRKPVGGTPIPSGVSLYYALATQFKLILLADTRAEKTELESWLATEGMAEHAMVCYTDVLDEELNMPERRLAQVVDAGSRMFDVVLVVEPDPSVCEALFTNGYSVMSFLHQQYALPEWRPDHDPAIWHVEGEEHPQTTKPWNLLAQEVEHNNRLRAADERLRQPDVQ